MRAGLVIVLVLCAWCLAESFLSFADVEGNLKSDSCVLNKTTGKCDGHCSNSLEGCTEYKPGHCGCKECSYDYGTGDCNSAGCYQAGMTWCMYTGNEKCECSGCAWADSSKDRCFGACSNSLCFQKGPASDCHCNQDKCSWDYASEQCVGACDKYGHQLCVQTANATCTCSSCDYDVALKQCMSPVYGCTPQGSSVDHGGCYAPRADGECSCTTDSCFYDHVHKKCISPGFGCPGTEECVLSSPGKCRCK
ncbi:hypothetical protein KIPB_000589 [Kipferlia bialata]|uniref:TNFR-Cys domain-containing protein n=1 Tax=Kipferlia bialata TaxID=797122 RepID=A0A9K3CMR3_9EUKA|nr:hypothetical protein KIPB_000589 [Kipferlia bialata]|eukprot:g589.t1